jgi:hypothetical protein
MSTGINWRAAVLAAGFSFTLFFTGCGGSGGDGAVAPASLQGRSYDFSPNTGGQTAVSFTSDTAYTFQHETGAIEQGSYEAQRDGNNWTVKLLATTGGQQIYQMAFANDSSGTFVLKRDGEDDRFGPFNARSTAVGSGDIGDPPTQPGSTTDNNPPITPSTEYNGFAPVSIAGRTMEGTRTFTSTGPTGQTHTYTFGNGTFHDSDSPEESGGTFTYTAGRSSATLTLNYTSPASFAGDQHTWNMSFKAKDQGTFTSTYAKDDGTEITINGNFQFEPIP